MKILLITCLLVWSVSAEDDKCSPDVKVDCGYFGIGQKECEDVNNCCWEESEVEGEPWCFNTAGCGKEDKDKVDCREYSAESCEAKGCCFIKSYNWGVPWCFYSDFELSPECAAVEQREDCGVIGTTEEECEKNGCCWEPKNGQPWCFHPAEVKVAPEPPAPETTAPPETEPEAPETEPEAPETKPEAPETEPEAQQYSPDRRPSKFRSHRRRLRF